jgi:PilZ domain
MATSTENVMNERRNGPRHRTQKTGIIKLRSNDGIHHNGSVVCRVRNLSPTGARLEVASQIGIPDNFVLWIEFDELEQPCQVTWRTATRLGVKFTAIQPTLTNVGARSTTSTLYPVSGIAAESLVERERPRSLKPRWLVWR